jgi:hypothetical protein
LLDAPLEADVDGLLYQVGALALVEVLERLGISRRQGNPLALDGDRGFGLRPTKDP